MVLRLGMLVRVCRNCFFRVEWGVVVGVGNIGLVGVGGGGVVFVV